MSLPFQTKKHLTYIIAEAGSNHNQKIDRAKELIDVATQAGADAIKFQLFKAQNLYKEDHPAFDIVKQCEFPREWMNEITTYCKQKDITFLASPFDTEAIQLLKDYNCPAIKMASSETTNIPLLIDAAKTELPIILSTAMSNLADIYEAIEAIQNTSSSHITLLQCTGLYPTNPEDVHLNVLDQLKAAFQLPIGFSDHTLGTHIPLAAVAKGAQVIEKHFTLDRNLEGPDHSYAIEPDELIKMVQDIRDIESALGTPKKVMLTEESKVARRESIITTQQLNSGDTITPDKVKVDRPGTGIPARFLTGLTNRKLNKDIPENTPITWDDIA